MLTFLNSIISFIALLSLPISLIWSLSSGEFKSTLTTIILSVLSSVSFYILLFIGSKLSKYFAIGVNNRNSIFAYILFIFISSIYAFGVLFITGFAYPLIDKSISYWYIFFTLLAIVEIPPLIISSYYRGDIFVANIVDTNNFCFFIFATILFTTNTINNGTIAFIITNFIFIAYQILTLRKTYTPEYIIERYL